ncbi:hypothetical protein D8674_020047 [Pyrus ussuriensis x Pyrus communis]|uniref:Uncharacterized protein n=1 Tax=Pyrus ussuriensis x Pyrus communis TaxID=2448454 RepID=A0A5N5HEJ8_9ROSA|nr:hypothetical protein D8674_020047 [Pyrus ussuriensis x Pyrus communis]
MADSGEGFGKKKLVVRSERYRWKQVLYFGGKNMVEAYAEFVYDIGNLVRMDCFAKFESWKKVIEELKKSMLGELLKKAKANKSNREKKTILHHSSSRPFSYRSEVRRQVITKGSKFPEIDVFSDIYVRPRDELAESLHRQLVLQESASQLPPETSLESVDPPEDVGFQILTETFEHTLRRRPMTYSLTVEVADLRIELASYKSQMSQITFEPLQPEHAHNSTLSTFEPIPNLETLQLPLNDDPIDYTTLFY